MCIVLNVSPAESNVDGRANLFTLKMFCKLWIRLEIRI